MISNFYQNLVLKNPKIILILLVITAVFFGYKSKDFRLDASSETLLIEGDPDLKYLQEINEKFGSKDFLVLTVTPIESITSDTTINNLLSLKYKIQSLDWVHNVITILDIPLLDSSDEPLMDRIKNYRTLKDENVDRERGFKEIVNSPVFRNFVISEDKTTTGIIVNLKNIEKLDKNSFKTKKDLEIYKDKLKENNHNNIIEIRNIIKSFENIGKIHLGGVPMIADDMMTFIKSDIVVFGIGVFLFIVITLWYVFRKLIWIVVPIGSCFFSVLIMTGFLGVMGWKVTVISSNFIALMLILTMAMNIHLSTRFLQLKSKYPTKKLNEIIFISTSKMFWPIAYTVLTTICAFLSLIFSEIKPIIDFGWMMTFGLITSFVVTFTLLPSLLNLMVSDKVEVREKSFTNFTNFLSNISIKKNKLILLISSSLIILSIVGISKLKVENSFINYFSKDTEIYQGMKLIDEKLGGTTPLDIILKFDVSNDNGIVDQKDDFEDWDQEENEDDSKYWFTKDKIDRIKNVHSYLENLNYIGKVLSFYSIIEIATQLNNNKDLGTLEMGVLYSKLPESIKKEIVDPYISVKDNEARISLRIKDSSEGLRRNELINKINYDLQNQLGLSQDSFKLGGILILFNNLLQSLFKSQILTLGLVMLGIFIMFLILFRNIKISLIGVIPNFIAAFSILGLIGLLNIPLDMMTITIAAITIGIAVDNSIHYIYRFIEEYKNHANYNQVVRICHSTVGVAILNTSITIVFGFSILVLSNFIPTIYFGIFTGIAMLLAMLLVLTLLPCLINLIKPFGIERND
tara:strand:+ start:17868 stop:20270 length:2403 start_codon:yes stop_codon:yes gene_type:complete